MLQVLPGTNKMPFITCAALSKPHPLIYVYKSFWQNSESPYSWNKTLNWYGLMFGALGSISDKKINVHAECAEPGKMLEPDFWFSLSVWCFPYMFRCRSHTFAMNVPLCAAAYVKRTWRQYLTFYDPLPLSYVQVCICVAVRDNC